jgi:hypothetical protein
MPLEDGIDELEVDTCRAEGMGMLLRGDVSRRYGWSRHWRLVSRLSGSYLRRSRMQCTNETGTTLSNSECMSLGRIYSQIRQCSIC